MMNMHTHSSSLPLTLWNSCSRFRISEASSVLATTPNATRCMKQQKQTKTKNVPAEGEGERETLMRKAANRSHVHHGRRYLLLHPLVVHPITSFGCLLNKLYPVLFVQCLKGARLRC